MSGGDGVDEIMNIDGTLNIIFNKYDTYFEFISRVRRILGIVVNKSNYVPIVFNVKHHLSDIEMKELEETLNRFELIDFVCIN